MKSYETAATITITPNSLCSLLLRRVDITWYGKEDRAASSAGDLLLCESAQ